MDRQTDLYLGIDKKEQQRTQSLIRILGGSWAERHARSIGRPRIVATATASGLLRDAMADVGIRLVRCGPLGGDQQIGAMIAQGELEVLLFYPDPLAAQPHDVDVKALLRLVLVHDIPTAFSASTATALAGSGLFG